MKRSSINRLAALVLITAALAGCGTTPKETQAPDQKASPQTQAPASTQSAPSSRETVYPITVKDAAGREITFDSEPKRIVSMVPGHTELVFALGKGSSLVGRSDFCDFPAEAKQIESVGGFFPPNYEKIVAAKPDLILLLGGSEEARTKLETEYKLTTLVLDPQNFTQLYEGMKLLGRVLNAQEAAERLIADMQAATKAVEEKVAKATTKPVVFYEVWNDPLQTTGPNTFMDDMIRLAGGVNAAANAEPGWALFSVEQLVAANPDLILASSPDAAKAILERKGWESIKAVKTGRVVGAPDQNLIVRPGPRLIQGLNWMAEQIHPELSSK